MSDCRFRELFWQLSRLRVSTSASPNRFCWKSNGSVESGKSVSRFLHTTFSPCIFNTRTVDCYVVYVWEDSASPCIFNTRTVDCYVWFMYENSRLLSVVYVWEDSAEAKSLLFTPPSRLTYSQPAASVPRGHPPRAPPQEPRGHPPRAPPQAQESRGSAPSLTVALWFTRPPPTHHSRCWLSCPVLFFFQLKLSLRRTKHCNRQNQERKNCENIAMTKPGTQTLRKNCNDKTRNTNTVKTHLFRKTPWQVCAWVKGPAGSLGTL